MVAQVLALLSFYAHALSATVLLTYASRTTAKLCAVIRRK